LCYNGDIPADHVGAADVADDGADCAETIRGLTATRHEQFAERARFESEIQETMHRLGYQQ
jgi:hypothetical protein